MEVLVTTASGGDTNNESKTSLIFWDPINGTKLLTLRGLTSSAQPHSMSFIKNEGILIAESGKPFIHYWQCGSLQTSSRIMCPGKPGPTTISPCGHFIVVAMNDQIVIWQVETGRVVNVINSAHFRPITVLKFTKDGTFLLTSSQDGIVHVWTFIQIVSKVSSTPTYTWSHHSLAVTDLYVSNTGIGRKSHIFTVSMDRTMKLYSLVDGELLISMAFPSPLTTITVDACENNAYVGTSNGIIYQCKLSALPRNVMEQHIGTESSTTCVQFKKHYNNNITSAITCLSISADGQTLASGDELGNIYLWDTISGQPIKTIASAPTATTTAAINQNKITNMQFWLGSPENWKPGSGQKPTIEFPEAAKLIEGQNQQDKHEWEHIVNVWNRTNTSLDLEPKFTNEELRQEIASLKSQLVKAEQINIQLHGYCLQNVLNGN